MDKYFPDTFRSIHHDGSSKYISVAGSGAPKLGDLATVRIRAAEDAPIERVLVRISPDGEQRLIEMDVDAGVPGSACRWWRTQMPISNPTMHYRFLIMTPWDVLWYNARGIQHHIPTDSEDFRLLADYQAPRWVNKSVFYQIFPDRFADGDSRLNVRENEFEHLGVPAYARTWGDPPASHGWEEVTEYYGGDLIGIRERLDYLQELGVNAIYLNPIFKAYSNHRYDVVDYYEIDPHLGGNEALIALSQEMKRRDMQFILDIVPNHCGYLHPWFQGAQSDAHSSTADFFVFQEHPHAYESWLGVPLLPKLNYRSQALREVMYSGENAIFRYWLRPPYSADGWRIDVANMLGRLGAEQLGLEVGREIRKAVKAENGQAYLMGEHFFDASTQLQGDCWDGVMNYTGFTHPLLYWLKNFGIHQHSEPHHLVSGTPWKTSSLIDTWRAYLAAIPWVIASQQLNLLGSHDTERIASYLSGEKDLMRLAVGVMMTFPGVPCIYYGDEIGLGIRSMGTRQCMLWDHSTWDQEIFEFYQKLVHLRRTSPALMEGGFQIFFEAQDTFAYLRDTERDYLIVIAHRGPNTMNDMNLPVQRAGIPNGLEFTEVLSGRRLTVEEGYLPIDGLSPGIQIWDVSEGA